MSGPERIFDEEFEGPLLRFSEEQEELFTSGDRRRYEAFRSKDRAFGKFLAKLEAIQAAENPAARLKPLRGGLAQNFPRVSNVRVGKWRAYYELDAAVEWIVGLVVRFDTVSEKHLTTALRKARKRSVPKPAPTKSTAKKPPAKS